MTDILLDGSRTKTLADLCRRDSTPLDTLLESCTFIKFDSKPSFTEVLSTVSSTFFSQKKQGSFYFTYENTTNISTHTTLSVNLAKGSALMFLLCVMQKLNLSVLSFVDGKIEDYYTPRWFALLEIVTVHYVMGNQEPLKRKRSNGMSLAEMTSDREKAWRRYKHTFFVLYIVTYVYKQ